MNRFRLIEDLERDSPPRLKPYKDEGGKWCIGVSRNLTDNGISREECNLMLHNDIDAVEKALNRAFPHWQKLSEGRARALANMCFNLGLPRLLQFRVMLQALEWERYNEAADAALDSRWAVQVGERAERIAELLRKG